MKSAVVRPFIAVAGYPPKTKMLHVSIIMIYIGVEESICQINLIKFMSEQECLASCLKFSDVALYFEL